MSIEFLQAVNPKDPSKFLAKHRSSKKTVFVEKVTSIKQKELVTSSKLDIYSRITTHPNCSNLLEIRYNPESKEAFYVFEYFPKDLKQCLDKGVFAKSNKAVVTQKILKQILNSLSNMHKNKVIFMNLNLRTINILGNDIVKLCDFTRASPFSSKKPKTFWTENNVGYLSADQRATSKVDSYSVGCIMFDLAAKLNNQSSCRRVLKRFLWNYFQSGQQFRKKWNKKLLHPVFAKCSSIPNTQNLPYLLARLIQKYRISIYSLSLLSNLLHPNYKKRMTVAQALQHPYFKSKPERHFPKNKMKKYLLASAKSKYNITPKLCFSKFRSGRIRIVGIKAELARPVSMIFDLKMNSAIPIVIEKPKEKYRPIVNRSSVNLMPSPVKSTRTNSLPDTPKKSVFRCSSPDILQKTPEKIKNPKLWRSPTKKESFVSFRRKFDEFESKISVPNVRAKSRNSSFSMNGSVSVSVSFEKGPAK